MKKQKRRVLLDTNVLSYIASCDAATKLAEVSQCASTDILISPTVIEEIRNIPDAKLRKLTLKVATRNNWIRLMPDAYSECLELKKEVKRLRPHWGVLEPKFTEFNRLRYDWIRKSGGYWERAENDVVSRVTDESIRAKSELELARVECKNIRTSVLQARKNGELTNLNHVAFSPEIGTLGWNGNHVDYWRMPSLEFFRKELMVYASPYREWLDNEIDVFAMLANNESTNRLWLHELEAQNVPRQWMRGAFEFLMSWHKITNGTPGDCTLSTYLVDSDLLVSADKNFVNFANRCNAEAPFKTAKGVKVQAGEMGVVELMEIIVGGSESTH